MIKGKFKKYQSYNKLRIEIKVAHIITVILVRAKLKIYKDLFRKIIT